MLKRKPEEELLRWSHHEVVTSKHGFAILHKGTSSYICTDETNKTEEPASQIISRKQSHYRSYDFR
jgi:hypothetical protein